MATCSWKPCGAELDTEKGQLHPEHEAWAKDSENEYVQVKRPDGSVDVYRKRRP